MILNVLRSSFSQMVSTVICSPFIAVRLSPWNSFSVLLWLYAFKSYMKVNTVSIFFWTFYEFITEIKFDWVAVCVQVCSSNVSEHCYDYKQAQFSATLIQNIEVQCIYMVVFISYLTIFLNWIINLLKN